MALPPKKEKSGGRIPALQLAKARKTYERLVDAYKSRELSGTRKALDLFATILSNALSTTTYSVSSEQLQPTLSTFLGRDMVQEDFEWLFHFLAANIDSFHQGKLVIPLLGEAVPIDDYVALEFVDVTRPEIDGPLVYELKVIWGTAYGRSVEKNVRWGTKQFDFFAWQLKLANRRQPISLLPRDLIGLRLFAKLDIHRIDNTKFTFHEFQTNNTLDTFNRKVIADRRAPCIKGLNTLCAMCALTKDKCYRSTRPAPLTVHGEELHVPDISTPEGESSEAAEG